MTIRRISLPVLVVLALAGCANNSGESVGAPAPAPASASPSASSPAPTVSSSPATSSSAPSELSGTITAGVEPNCLLLDGHLLIVNDPKLKSAAKVGATVTATGRVEPGMMTTCQQGTPFIVTSLRAN
jgi:hypothetical protein